MTYSKTVPLWMQQGTPFPGYHGCSGSMFFSGYKLALEVYGAPGADQSAGLTAFAYCWRRFGPPWHGSDPDNDLVAYVLGTPHAEVFLRLALRGSGLCYNVGYLASHDVEQALYVPEQEWEARFEDWWVTCKTTTEEQALLAQAAQNDPLLQPLSARYWNDRMEQAVIREAETVVGIHPGRAPRDWEHTHPMLAEPLTAALTELLRPVFIRDVAINILGHVPDDKLDERDNADASRYAGYGVPQHAMDTLIKQAVEEE